VHGRATKPGKRGSRAGEASPARARAYDSAGRQARAEELSARILDVVLGMVEGQDAPDVSLEAAAQAAQVSVPTLVRKFGSKDGLYAAAFARARTRYRASRELEDGADKASAAVRAQLAIYERWGRALLYLRTQESGWPVVREELETGRRERRAWLERTFADALSEAARQGDAAPRARERREDALAQLFALTDVHLWAVFRLDLGFGRTRTEKAMVELLRSWVVQTRGAGGG
jgi:AcrR family transcriptional regulator